MPAVSDFVGVPSCFADSVFSPDLFKRVAAYLARSCSETFSMLRAALMARLACCTVRYLRPTGSTNSRHSRPFLPFLQVSVRHPSGNRSGGSFGLALAAASVPLLALTPNSRVLLSPSLPSCATSPPNDRKATRSTALRRNSTSAGMNSRDLRASCRNASSSAVLGLKWSCETASSTLPAACNSTNAATNGSRRQPGSRSPPEACCVLFAATALPPVQPRIC
mmetsp:Transcript_147888/g.411885  ORF Transcript_147888/g.411885 Transcript_147888/m.411885 type:complete len:222 (-) Transcript_147888:2046-2711(-)